MCTCPIDHYNGQPLEDVVTTYVNKTISVCRTDLLYKDRIL